MARAAEEVAEEPRYAGIRSKGPGVWEVRVHVGRDPLTGRVRQVSRTVRGGINAAKHRRSALQTEVDQGLHGGSQGTFGSLLTDWLAEGTRTKSAKTVAEQRRKIEKVIRPALGHIDLDELRALHIAAFYRSRQEAGDSAALCRHYHRIISAVLNYGVRLEWLGRNPAQHVAPPRPAPPVVVVLTPEQITRLIREGEGSRQPILGLAILLGATTGMRRGELCGLRWSDVDLDLMVLSVRRSVWQVIGDDKVGTASGWGVKLPKWDRVRTFPIDPATTEALRRQRVRAEEQAATAEVEIVADAYVLSTDVDGATPMLPDSLTQAYGRVRDRCAGITREDRSAQRRAKGAAWGRLHDLRHFAGTQMIAAGIDPRTAADRLGHSDPSVTLGIYTHTLDHRARAAADLLGELVAPASSIPKG